MVRRFGAILLQTVLVIYLFGSSGRRSNLENIQSRRAARMSPACRQPDAGLPMRRKKETPQEILKRKRAAFARSVAIAEFSGRGIDFADSENRVANEGYP